MLCFDSVSFCAESLVWEKGAFTSHFVSDLVQRADFLEALSSAWRALLQTMASKNISQVRHRQFLCETSQECIIEAKFVTSLLFKPLLLLQ